MTKIKIVRNIVEKEDMNYIGFSDDFMYRIDGYGKILSVTGPHTTNHDTWCSNCEGYIILSQHWPALNSLFGYGRMRCVCKK